MTENYNPDIIVANIDLLCNQHGISINKMLSECKLNKSIVDNMKKGSVPSVDKLQKISNYFKCSIDYLLGNEPKEEPLLDKTDQEILVLARKTQELPEEDKKRFLEILRGSVNAFLKEDK